MAVAPPAMLLPDEVVFPADRHLHLLRVPAGPFWMGEGTTGHANETVGFTITLDDFYIGKYEVTVAQYKKCVDADGCTPITLPPDGQLPSHPVTNVAWHDAVQFAEWLDQNVRTSTGMPEPLKNLLGAGWRFGLPSEAEWEKAARGTDGRSLPWGEGEGPELANYMTTYLPPTFSGPPLRPTPAVKPVGSFPKGKSPFGALDMSGNVWEWTRSLDRPYPYVPNDGREAPTDREDDRRVLRGGHFGNGVDEILTAHRFPRPLGAERSPKWGFRIALLPPSKRPAYLGK